MTNWPSARSWLRAVVFLLVLAMESSLPALNEEAEDTALIRCGELNNAMAAGTVQPDIAPSIPVPFAVDVTLRMPRI